MFVPPGYMSTSSMKQIFAHKAALRGGQKVEGLMERGVILVPDVLSSSGAVIDGIGRSVMGLSDRGHLLDEIRDTTFVILNMALEENIAPHRVAMDVAHARLAKAREAKL